MSRHSQGQGGNGHDQNHTQQPGSHGYQGSDYNSRGDTRGHGQREYHQPDYAQRDFSQRDFNQREWQHHQFGPADQRFRMGQPSRDQGPTFGDPRANQFDGRSDGDGGRGTHAVGGGHMDWSTGHQPTVPAQPSHRGRGPKGFKRSDDRIREAVSECLMDHHEIDASEISVEVQDGEVILSGTVDDRRTKRLAEHIVADLSGVHDVVNQIRVTRAGSPASDHDKRAETNGRNGADAKRPS